jgi:transporter family protein
MNWLAWSLLSAAFAAATALLGKRGLENIDSHLATALRTTVVLVFVWAVALAFAPAGALANVSRRSWLWLTLSGLATGLSWLCYFRALQLGEASRVAPIDKLSVVFVVLFAALFLGESLTARGLLGAGLIAAGAVLLAVK